MSDVYISASRRCGCRKKRYMKAMFSDVAVLAVFVIQSITKRRRVSIISRPSMQRCEISISGRKMRMFFVRHAKVDEKGGFLEFLLKQNTGRFIAFLNK